MAMDTSMLLPDLSGRRVLIVEDDDDGRRILIEVLEFAGAKVTACSDAYAALRALDDFQPHVIICDLALPRLDGLGFLQALRAHPDPNIRPTPMIAVTAYSDLYGPKELMSLRCEGYMMKPLSLERVCSAIEKLARAA
jgi:two-component system, cell cycle response regulator DivK